MPPSKPRKKHGQSSAYALPMKRPKLDKHLAAAEKALAAGKGVNWRKLRSDV